MEMSESRLLFRGICKGKYGEKLWYSGGLSYSRWRELLCNKLRQLGFPPNSFGLHSLRAGGATAAANAGVHDRLFKRHGQWKSEGAKDGYIEDSLVSDLRFLGGWVCEISCRSHYPIFLTLYVLIDKSLNCSSLHC